MELPLCPREAKEKDLLEPDRLKAVVSLQKYQDKIRAWRDSMVKLREIDVGHQVLLWSYRTESSGKLKSKWAGPYVVTKKSRLGAYRLIDF
jgi:hypothetical protein